MQRFHVNLKIPPPFSISIQRPYVILSENDLNTVADLEFWGGGGNLESNYKKFSKKRSLKFFWGGQTGASRLLCNLKLAKKR